MVMNEYRVLIRDPENEEVFTSSEPFYDTGDAEKEYREMSGICDGVYLVKVIKSTEDE